MLFFGLNNVFHFLPEPHFGGIAGEAFSLFYKVGYIMPTVAATQLFLAVALLTNRFVPAALLLFSPVLVNIVCFHLFLDLPGIVRVLPVAGAIAFLFYMWRSAFLFLFKP